MEHIRSRCPDERHGDAKVAVFRQLVGVTFFIFLKPVMDVEDDQGYKLAKEPFNLIVVDDAVVVSVAVIRRVVERACHSLVLRRGLRVAELLRNGLRVEIEARFEADVKIQQKLRGVIEKNFVENGDPVLRGKFVEGIEIVHRLRHEDTFEIVFRFFHGDGLLVLSGEHYDLSGVRLIGLFSSHSAAPLTVLSGSNRIMKKSFVQLNFTILSK